MLFQVTHKHDEETCPGVFPDKTKVFAKWWNDMKNTPGIKVLSGCVSPMDHTIYISVEADDFPTLARALGPMNSIGSGYTTPVIPLDQAMPMADEGAFRPR